MTYLTWLPFLGFRMFDVDNDGEITTIYAAQYEADFLVFEWLGEGFALFSGPRRPKVK